MRARAASVAARLPLRGAAAAARRSAAAHGRRRVRRLRRVGPAGHAGGRRGCRASSRRSSAPTRRSRGTRSTGRPRYATSAPAVRAFFRNGGRRCWVVRVAGAPRRPTRFPVPGVVRLRGGRRWTPRRRARARGRQLVRRAAVSTAPRQPLDVAPVRDLDDAWRSTRSRCAARPSIDRRPAVSRRATGACAFVPVDSAATDAGVAASERAALTVPDVPSGSKDGPTQESRPFSWHGSSRAAIATRSRRDIRVARCAWPAPDRRVDRARRQLDLQLSAAAPEPGALIAVGFGAERCG